MPMAGDETNEIGRGANERAGYGSPLRSSGDGLVASIHKESRAEAARHHSRLRCKASARESHQSNGCFVLQTCKAASRERGPPPRRKEPVQRGKALRCRRNAIEPATVTTSYWP